VLTITWEVGPEGHEREIDISGSVHRDDFGVRGSPVWHDVSDLELRDESGAEVNWEAFLEALSLYRGEPVDEDRVWQEIVDELVMRADEWDQDDDDRRCGL